MRQYDIYLIEDEIARHYYGSEWKLYNLFLESKQVEEGKLKQVIQKQIRYVVRPIPLQKVEGGLVSKYRRLPGYKADRHCHIMNDPGTASFARLDLRRKKLSLASSGKYDAEASFFEALRQIEDHFLAVDYGRDQFGWLKPIKNAGIRQS